MAEGDLTLTARLRLEVDPNQVRAELQKAGGIVGQAAGGGGGMAGGLAQRTGGGGDAGSQALRVLGLGAIGGGAVVGSYIVLQRILRLMENSPLFSSTLDLITSGISEAIGAITDRALGEGGAGAGRTFGISLLEFSSDVRGGMGILDAYLKMWMSLQPNPAILTGRSAGQNALMGMPGFGDLSGLGAGWQPTAKDYLPGGALWNGIMPSAYAMDGGGTLGSFMAQWGAENPGGAYGQWMGGPPSVFGMRSVGTYDTLASQLLSGTRLAQTSQWGNTDIGAQGQWWGPSADSGAIMDRIQKYYQVANYGGAGGWQWGDVSKLVEKFLSDPSRLDRSPGALFNEISGRIEPLGRTWWRSSEYGNFMSDVMTMGSPGITPPDIGTLFSGLTFAPEIKVTIGAQELNDIITQIIESGNFTTRTAI